MQAFVDSLNSWVWEAGIPVAGEVVPWVVIALLGTGVFLTFRLHFIQFRRLGHGFAITSGKYDDPSEPGDVPHFQALTTALSATVGIGNIAGVAIAIHYGGPGALFWMWMTALLGMAVKYTEVSLAQRYREVESGESDRNVGTVSGGPMYYIEKGLGTGWKPLAAFFAVMLGFTAFLTGNAVQANTVADTMSTEFGIANWATGIFTSVVVALVVLGGISRIGKVTGYMAPIMAAVYVLGALFILVTNVGEILPTFGIIFKEAFNPSAGVAGTGAGAFLMTLMWGVRRGLFSNEAGQGSAPIAHAAARTDEPVSEGVVGLLEPFIDTIVICTMTGLVVILTGVWNAAVPTPIGFSGGDSAYVLADATRFEGVDPPAAIEVERGQQQGTHRLAWHEVPVTDLSVDSDLGVPFTGRILPAENVAVGADGTRHETLHGLAVESGAPLTMLAFQRGLPGNWGRFIVIISVLLFAVSTAISWSYYGDRCANYLFGHKAIIPYKVVFVGMHFVGSMATLSVIWTMGDVALGIVILPNLLALILLSGRVKEMTDSYFQRRPWLENFELHKKLVQEGKKSH